MPSPSPARLPYPSPNPGVYSNPMPGGVAQSQKRLKQFSSSSMSIESVMPSISFFVLPFSSHLQSFPASGSFQMSQFFTSSGQNIAVSASTSVLPMKHPGLISFRMDWLDLLAVQGTLKSLLQYLSSKASIFRCSAFFIVQLSHPYMTTGKTIALTR